MHVMRVILAAVAVTVVNVTPRVRAANCSRYGSVTLASTALVNALWRTPCGARLADTQSLRLKYAEQNCFIAAASKTRQERTRQVKRNTSKIGQA